MYLTLWLAAFLSVIVVARGFPAEETINHGATLPNNNGGDNTPTATAVKNISGTVSANASDTVSAKASDTVSAKASDTVSANASDTVSASISDRSTNISNSESQDIPTTVTPNISDTESTNTTDTTTTNISDNMSKNTSASGNLTSPDNSDCECVRYYLCDDVILDTGLIDVPVLDEDNKCDDYLNVCCKSVRPIPEAIPSYSCGRRNEALPIRGVNPGREAQYGEFPWMMALLQYTEEGKQIYLCGGSLIHPQAVLTGAHCVQGKNNLVIRAGEWDTQSEIELYPTQDRNVSEVVIHENFNNKSLFNDIALLILESPLDLAIANGFVGSVCLPEQDEDFDNRDCVASGWGKDVYGKEGKYAVILKKVELPIVPRAPCQEALRKTKLGSKFNLHSSFICAGGIPGADTCQGDGGSPLACRSKADPNVYVQAGIVAWGISCGSETPATYVNLPAFVNWINGRLHQNGIVLT